MKCRSRTPPEFSEAPFCFCMAIFYFDLTTEESRKFLLDRAEDISLQDSRALNGRWECGIEGCRASGDVSRESSGRPFLTSNGAPEHVCKTVLDYLKQTEPTQRSIEEGNYSEEEKKRLRRVMLERWLG